MTLAEAEVVPDTRPDEMERRVCRYAQRFDLPSLLFALGRMGYGIEDLRFRGNPDPTPPRGIVQAISFEASPRRVVVTLNIGLNGHRGWLPAYFEEVAESLPEPEKLHLFVEFFEDGLLRDYARAVSPELHPRYRALMSAHFSMLGLASISTLTWLFEQTFPELGVRVGRKQLNARTDAFALSIGGRRRLNGNGVLGASYDAGASGFSVGLYADDEYAPTGRTWWTVATERIRKQIVPMLARTEIRLDVALLVSDHASWARIGTASQLGYDRLFGEAGEHRVPVYRDGAFCGENLTPPRRGRWTPLSPWNTQAAAAP